MPTSRTPHTVTIRMGALHNELTAGTFTEPLHHPEPPTKWNHKDRSAKHRALGQTARLLSNALGLQEAPFTGAFEVDTKPKAKKKKRWHHPRPKS